MMGTNNVVILSCMLKGALFGHFGLFEAHYCTPKKTPKLIRYAMSTKTSSLFGIATFKRFYITNSGQFYRLSKFDPQVCSLQAILAPKAFLVGYLEIYVGD